MAYTDPSTLTWQTEEKPTSAKMNQATNDQFLAVLPNGVAGASWTPVLKGATSDPTTSSATGRQYQVGALMFVWARFVITDPGSGRWSVELPKAAANLTGDGTVATPGNIVGSWQAGDGVSAIRGGSVILRASGTVIFVRADPQFGGSAIGDTATFPFSSGVVSGSVLTFHAVYPAA